MKFKNRLLQLSSLFFVFLIISGIIIYANIAPRTSEEINVSPTSQPTTVSSVSPEISSFPSSSVPVQDETTVLVYFNNSKKTPEMQECNRVLPVKRVIARSPQIGFLALQELLKGPSAQEKQQGYFTSIPTGVRIQSLSVKDGTARADFNETLNQVGGSCRVAAISAQIRETLQQFPTVNNVVISVNGRTGDVLQP